MMLARLALASMLLAPLAAGANQSRIARSRVDVTGHYTSNYDDVTLVQKGDRVTGTYVCCGGGTIEGRVIEGSVIRYRWRQPGAEGRGVWSIDGSRLDGTWGVEQDDSGSGRWDLVRSSN